MNIKERFFKGIRIFAVQIFLFLLMCILIPSKDLTIVSFVRQNKILIFLAVIPYFLIFFNLKKELWVTLIILFYGSLFALFTPILNSPDEPAHMCRAAATANGNFFVHKNPYIIEKEYVEILENGSAHKTISTHTLSKSYLSKNKNFDMSGYPGSSYPFVGYLAPSIGINIAKIFNLSMAWVFYLGRIFNLLMYAGLAYLAFILTPKFKMSFFMIAMMPMAVAISATFNQDALVYGLALIIFAYFLKLNDENHKQISSKNMILFAVLIILLTLLKYHLIVFSLLLLLLPASKFSGKHKKIIQIGVIYLLTLITVALYLRCVVYNSNWESNQSAITGVDAIAQIKFMLANPKSTLGIIWLNFLENLELYKNHMFTFGWLDIPVNINITNFYFLFFVIVSLFYTDKNKLSKLEKLVPLLIMLGGYFGIHMILYLTFTLVGNSYIDGVQGRYLIPLLLCLPLLKSKTMVVEKNENTDKYLISFCEIFLSLSFLTIVAYHIS